MFLKITIIIVLLLLLESHTQTIANRAVLYSAAAYCNPVTELLPWTCQACRKIDGVSITCIVFGLIIMFGAPFTVYDGMIKGIFMIFGLLLIGLGILIKHLDMQRHLLMLLKAQKMKNENDTQKGI